VSAPLILLPGMMCDARLFGPQSGAIRLIVLPITGAETVQALAAEVLARAPDRFALGGLSMGGIVAMEVVRQAPGRVAGLALMDTNPRAEPNQVKARRQPQMDRAAAGGLAAVMRDEMKPNYLAEGPARADILDLCMDMALGLGPDVFIRQSRALRDRPDQCATLRGYPGPALVLCGRDDSLCPLARHEEMHALLPQSTLRVIEGAGHLPTLERPEPTTEALRLWLEEL
jgi:pimeloyl-ACP methyl ester carboxylesterase